MPEPLVDAIVAYAVEHPTHGQRTIADALARERFGRWAVSHGGVANVLRRAGLERRLARPAAAESLAASEGGPLTERVLREVRAIERAVTVHIGSEVPGEELFFDTFYVGNVKGVGKVWQLSAVEGASSFGIARVIAGPKTAAVMARFLLDDVLPVVRRAGLRLVTPTTDNGPEFGRPFGEACATADVRQHRIPPRSPKINAFVERSRGPSCISTTGSPSATATTPPLRRSTPISGPSCGSTSSSDHTVAIGRRAAPRRASSSVSSPNTSVRWEHETMTDMTTNLSGRNVGRKP